MLDSPRLKKWLARAAFGVAVLALLGTSQPRWTIAATITNGAANGADAGGVLVPAPPSGMSLLASVDASRGPQMAYTNRFGTKVAPMWAYGSSEVATKTSFLLPPSASLASLEISGHCGGGCCSNEKCVPPNDAFIRATVEPVHIWTKMDTKSIALEIKAPAKGTKGTIPRLSVSVDDGEAVRTLEVIVKSKTGEPVLGWNAKPIEAMCIVPSRMAPTDAASDAAMAVDADAGSTTTTSLTCSAYPFSARKTAATIEVIVEATTFGACQDPKAACSPPINPPSPRISSVELL